MFSSALIVSKKTASFLRKNYINDAKIICSKKKDIKTEADMASEKLIISNLKKFRVHIISEESAKSSDDCFEKEMCWIIDPLDGTLNFSRGFNIAAISIGLWLKGKPIFGVICDVYTGKIYSGVFGKSANLNGLKIKTSKISKVREAVFATGFPNARSYEDEPLIKFAKSVQKYKKIRMLGSASMMLAQVAAGHFDIYEEENIYLWDVAAGLAIVKAAGGSYTLKKCHKPFVYNVRATNGILK